MRKHLTRARMRSIGALLGVAALGATLAPSFARADTVTDWNDTASTAIVGVAKQPPPVAVMSFAMVQGAVYDAVEAIDGRYRPYLATPPARRTDSAGRGGRHRGGPRARGCPRRPPARPTGHAAGLLQPRYDASLAAIADGPSKTRGIADGEQAAAAMLAARHDDGNPTTGSTSRSRRCPAPPRAPGGPRRRLFATDPAPWVANVRPFLVPSVDMLRVAGPNPLTSRAYARDFNEIKSRRRAAQHHAHARRDRRGDLLAGERLLAVQPHLPHPGGRQPPVARRQRADAGDDQPGRRRRGDRLLEREVPLELLAPDHRHPRGRHRRQPGHHGRSGPGCRCSTRRPPSPRGRRRWSPRRSPTTRRATSAPPARSSARCSTSSAATASPFSATQQRVRHHPPLRPALRRAARGDQRPRVGAASTSAPPTSRAHNWARRSPATSAGTTSSRPASRCATTQPTHTDVPRSRDTPRS